MHLDKNDFNVYMFSKFGIVLAIILLFPLKFAVLTLMIVAATYQHVVAHVYELHVMPSMDRNCFMSNDKAVANIISATTMSEGKPEYAREAFGRLIDAHMKARSEVVRVFGDMYYKEIDKAVAYEKCIETLPDGLIKNQEDLEKYVAEWLPEVFPDEMPKWKVLVQRNYLGDKGLVLFKAHHSFCDGISSMAVNL